MKKFIKVTISLVLLTLMLVLSCSIGFAEEKVISFARPEDVITLDPGNWGKMNVNVILNYLIYDRLIELNPETGPRYIPALATEWKISPDGKEYTFKLREGVKFHNGEPFNAESVKVTFERYLNEKLFIGEYSWGGLKEVEVVDDYTVIIKFNDVDVADRLISFCFEPMLPVKAFKEQGTALFDNPIGTGAFTWGHWKRGQEIVLNRNADYWGKPAYMDKFIYLPINEASTRLAGVTTGEIDIVDTMTADQIPMAESSGNITIIRSLALDWVTLMLKTGIPPFTDIKFRKAMALAIDKEGIVNYIMKGGKVATGCLFEGCEGFDDSLVPEKQDIEKAKQLVKESVYDGRIIEIMVPIGWIPNEKDVALAIKGNFEEVGINTKVTVLEGATFSERRAKGDYDIMLDEDGGLVGTKFYVREIAGDIHSMGNINPELKKVCLEQKTIIDDQKRIEAIRKIRDIMNADYGPVLYVCQMEAIYFTQKGIQGGRHYGSKWPDLRYVRYEEW